MWCGEGWRALVSQCHNELAAAFPEFRIDAIEQTEGVLVFRARARAGKVSDEEVDAVRRITMVYATASEAVCEWCGRPGSPRAEGAERLTLCDACTDDMKTSMYPTSTSSGLVGRTEAITSVSTWIETVYNRRRRWKARELDPHTAEVPHFELASPAAADTYIWHEGETRWLSASAP